VSEIELQLRYRPDDEWHGELDAVVRSSEFSGKGSAWFGREYIRTNFASALRAFPLSVDDPPLIEGGFGSKERPGSLEQCHLRIAVRPYNSRGTILMLVQVHLATKSWASPDKDLQQSVTVRFLTEYAALDEFAAQLEQALDGKREWAILSGTA
jgi:hypothetical protein